MRKLIAILFLCTFTLALSAQDKKRTLLDDANFLVKKDLPGWISAKIVATKGDDKKEPKAVLLAIFEGVMDKAAGVMVLGIDTDLGKSSS